MPRVSLTSLRLAAEFASFCQFGESIEAAVQRFEPKFVRHPDTAASA